MNDLRDHDGLSREALFVAMARALRNVDPSNKVEIGAALARAGFTDDEILPNWKEAARREALRLHAYAMRAA